MTAAFSILILFFVLCSYNLLVIGRDLTLEPGHLKPFGFGSNEPVEEVTGFPEPEDFFRTYVWPIKPLKMKGAAKISPAFEKWADEYFLSQDYSGVEKVTVETMKKESRQQQVTELTFPDFVRIYNNSEYYMVNSVPGVLRYLQIGVTKEIILMKENKKKMLLLIHLYYHYETKQCKHTCAIRWGWTNGIILAFCIQIKTVF